MNNCCITTTCRGTVRGNMQVGTTTAIMQLPVTVCAVKEKRQLFRIYVETNIGATQTVELGFCNGGSFPIFLQSTGAQATATNFVAGVTYLVSFDNFSGKFFLVGF